MTTIFFLHVRPLKQTKQTWTTVLREAAGGQRNLSQHGFIQRLQDFFHPGESRVGTDVIVIFRHQTAKAQHRDAHFETHSLQEDDDEETYMTPIKGHRTSVIKEDTKILGLSLRG